MRTFFIAVILFCNFDIQAQPNKAHLSELHHFTIADSLIQLKKFDQASATLRNILNKGKAAHDKVTMAKAYSLIGNIFLMQRNPDKALQNYFLSLDEYQAANDPAGLAKVYTNVGTVYSILKELPKAREYYLKALSSNKTENLDRLKTTVNLAGVYAELKEKKLAVNTFNKGISLARKLNNLPLEAVLRTNLSNYFIEEKDWNSAILNARNSLAIRSGLKQPASVITLNNLGYALVQTKQYKEGINCYDTALKSANPQERKQLYFNLYHAHKSLANLPKALKYLEQYDTVKDSLSKLNYEQKVAEITANYESLKKQGRINNLEHENIRQKKQLRQQLFLIIAGVLIILLVSVLIYLRVKNYSIKEALEKSQIKRQLLLLQLNPHFIFNALQSVQRFIYLKDQEQSMEYLNSFSKLIRLTLENSDKDLIALDEEIEILDNYLHLQQLNHHPGFTYEINVNPNIETENIEIPVMLLQPFVENAVVHGLKDHQNGKIRIVIKQKSDGIHIFIMDNGPGADFTGEHANNKMHRSMATDILNQRILEFNREKTNYVTLRVGTQQDIDYPGTAVHLHIAI
ncbi:Tetratricopeptide repeat-containing protein [Pedobacter westerhofensis]|uniref:Tetratricopeptide repeat-containing protein n=1 Tax=Pedobacter westerhofensis TaxID=425512 RepID=A0A521EVU9_9SPHI|nr:tetratricopeptide repeat protein [Pedobacter westerhofensis]SMO87220.1 Tetratricopeptide repeat-containing protein [Pedobacter westerhofensis]